MPKVGWDMRSSRVLTAAAAVLALAASVSALLVQGAGAQPPSTSVVVPSNDATVSGTNVVLDATAASGVTQVQFEVTGGGLSDSVVATAAPSVFGWIALWNSKNVPDGTYTLQSVASEAGTNATSPGISVTVDNPLTTSILLPSNGATLTGSTYLDAAASNATSVEFLLFGGTYEYAAPVICTATPTFFGWLCAWNTATVPNGSYALVSEAFNSTGGSAFSASGVGITVDNPTVSFASSTFFTYPSEEVSLNLSQSSTTSVQVDFTIQSGPGAQLYWGAWTGAASSFSPSSGTVTFAPGQTNATIPFSVSPTTVTECGSTTPCYPSVTVTLANPTDAVLGSPAAANVFYAPVGSP